MRVTRLLTALVVLALGVMACRRNSAEDALRITIRRPSVDLAIGDTTTIIAVVSLTSDEAPTTVTWSSDDERIASVDQNGRVTARGAGIAVITARLGTAFATTRVSVSRRPSVRSVTFSPSSRRP